MHQTIYFTKLELDPYTTSHDAILPVIVKWCDKHGWGDFWIELCNLVSGKYPISVPLEALILTLSATPEQLSDALIREMGKWNEEA